MEGGVSGVEALVQKYVGEISELGNAGVSGVEALVQKYVGEVS